MLFKIDNNRGVTLVEMVIAITIAAIIAIIAANYFARESGTTERYISSTQLRQNVRAAMDLIVREARMIGYNPTTDFDLPEWVVDFDTDESTETWFANSTDELIIIANLNGDNDVDDEDEKIFYWYDAADSIIYRKTENPDNTEIVLENIADLQFEGRDVNDNPATDWKYMQKIVISMTGRVRVGRPKGGDDGYKNFSMNASVILRNVTPETDTDFPCVDTYIPPDEATDVSVSNNLILIFDEYVYAQSGGYIKLYKKTNDELIQSFDVTFAISGSGTTTITANPSPDLDVSTDYYVQIDATAFDDASGNSYAGIADETTWNFTTAANPNPQVSDFSPDDDSTDVPASKDLIITFDKAVDAETGGFIELYRTTGDVLIQSFDVENDITGTGSTTITANPSQNLVFSTDYYVKICATAFDDALSNSYAGIADETTWNFTTSANPDPLVSDFSPDDDSTDVPASKDLIITFDKVVEAESGYIKLYKTDGDVLIQSFDVENDITGTGSTKITANPTSDLEFETGYYVQIDADAFDDVSSNSYAGIADKTTWNFTTAADIVPVVFDFSPDDDSTNVPASKDLIITFNEVVDAESGYIKLYKTIGDVLVQNFDVTSAISGSGTTTITANPTSDLDFSTDYYVQIDADAFDDVSSNSYTGIADNTTWNFTTEEEGGFSGWQYSQKLGINTTSGGAGVSGDVQNFPLLVRLTSSNFTFSQARGDGHDIRFSSANGSTPLFFERERWDPGSSRAEFWVLIPTVLGNDDEQYIKMYWGNPGAEDASTPEMVFDVNNDFSAVWHLATDDYSNATSNDYDGSNDGITNTTGMVGGGKYFSGWPDDIEINVTGGGPSLSTFTTSFWFQLETNRDGCILGDDDNNYIFIQTTFGSALAFVGNGSEYKSNVDLSNNNWYYGVLTQSGPTVSFYVNGVFDRSVNRAFTMDFKIIGNTGSAWPNETVFQGKLDEIRISSVDRCPDWIKLSYKTQKTGSTVVSVIP